MQIEYLQSGTHYQNDLFSIVTVAVFKSRLKAYLFSQAFSFLCSITRCLAPALRKLWPYGAMQICL